MRPTGTVRVGRGDWYYPRQIAAMAMAVTVTVAVAVAVVVVVVVVVHRYKLR